MSDDQDDSETPPQLENVINELKSQSYSSGPSGPHNKLDLENLENAYDNLASIDKNLAQIKEREEEEKQRQQAFQRSEYSNDLTQKRETQREAIQKDKDELLARLATANDKI